MSLAPPVYRPIRIVDVVRRFREPGVRAMVWAWALLAVLAIPTGTATRALGWNGIPIGLGGLETYVTVYLPLLLAIPLVLWLGYGWAAIPAYLATACVAIVDGMPLPWAALFAFANPVGLTVYWLAYQALPVRTDLRSPTSVVFYVLVAFVSALVSSGGAFVWAHTNQVGFDALLPVWQGWWLGGFLQAVFVTGPVLFLLGPAVARWKHSHGLGRLIAEAPSRRQLLLTTGVVSAAVVAYVLVERAFSLVQLESALVPVAPALREGVLNAVEGLVLIHWVLLLLLFAVGLFGYHVAMRWVASVEAAAEAQARLNAQLLAEVAERTRAEAEVQAQAQALRKANETKDRFFSILAHDLRNPLSSVLMLSRMLTEQIDELDRKTSREFADHLHTSAENLFDLLENLLTWSRLQIGGLRHVPEALDLGALIRSVSALLRPHAIEKGITLRVHGAERLQAWADPNMIRSVVLNLLSNAIKFTEPGGMVTLSAGVQGGRVAVEVRDTGVGMTPGHLKGLFAIDTSSSTPGTAGESGSGLGLVLCHEMVSHHGSPLTVESAPGEGTAFSFSLPLAPTPARAPVSAPVAYPGG